MPTITRARATPAKPTLSNGSRSAWDLIDRLLISLWGESGTGKTTFWATMPGEITVAICSGGSHPGELRSINTPEYRKKISPVVIDTVADFEAWLAKVGNYATAVLDHATGFADLVLKELLGLEEIPAQKGWGLASQQQYGQQSLQLKTYLRTLLSSPCNVVIVSQERMFKGRDDGVDPEIVRPTMGPALTPSVCGWLLPACDYVVQTFKRPRMVKSTAEIGGKKIVTEARGKGVEYCLRTGPHDTFMTKFRVPKGTPLPECIVDPTYDKMMALIRGEK